MKNLPTVVTFQVSLKSQTWVGGAYYDAPGVMCNGLLLIKEI